MFWTAIIGVTLRGLLYLAGAQSALEDHVELVTPSRAYFNLKECYFLKEAGTSPYAGKTCRYPPLVLQLLEPLRAKSVADFLTFGFYVLLDLATSLLLSQFAMQYKAARERNGKAWMQAAVKGMTSQQLDQVLIDAAVAAGKDGDTGLKDPVLVPLIREQAPNMDINPNMIGSLFFLNPIGIASCVAHSMQGLHHFFAVAALVCAGAGRGGAAAFALAALLYVQPVSGLVFLPSIAYLAWHQGQANHEEPDNTVVKPYVPSRNERIIEFNFILYCFGFATMVAAILMCLCGLSLAYVGGALHFIDACYVSILNLVDLTPNIGLRWYLFIEMFPRFRSMFCFIIWAHPFLYAFPLLLRLGQRKPMGPWLNCMFMVSIAFTMDPYPTATDLTFMFSLLLIPTEVLRQPRFYFVFLASGMFFPLIVCPTMSTVWIDRNAGNANYMFAMIVGINAFALSLMTCWFIACQSILKRMKRQAFCHEIVNSVLEDVLQKPK